MRVKVVRPWHPTDSPVEVRRKEMPRGDGNWPGYAHVWDKLQEAAHSFTGYSRLSTDHVDIMAAMGTGHEETMKHYMALAYAYNWAKP